MANKNKTHIIQLKNGDVYGRDPEQRVFDDRRAAEKFAEKWVADYPQRKAKLLIFNKRGILESTFEFTSRPYVEFSWSQEDGYENDY